jgi:anti-sigma regulatory factor (Ser/Thr protein kinase)/predicted transcriptional regulator
MSFKKEERENIKKKLIEFIGDSEDNRGFEPTIFAKDNNVSVQTIYRYLNQLNEEKRIEIKCLGKKNEYSLVKKSYAFEFKLSEITEDKVWRESIHPILKDIPETAYRICNYAFTEMLNNAIDHSEGTHVEIGIIDNSYKVCISIEDNGIGIFSKISEAMNLDEKRFAVLELAKGKFTTDPKSHSGEGIFFSSKATDIFAIFSDELMFQPINLTNSNIADSVLSDEKSLSPSKGTAIVFKVLYNSKHTLKDIFDKYTEEAEDYGFTKTMVPVKLLEYVDDFALFTSRSQAKRLVARFERFKHIELDFTGVDEIGQGFSDEIFRVFANQHPEIYIYATNCSGQVQKMINRAKNAS